MAKAERAIIIAHLAEEKKIIKAKKNGCTIVHRLDEHFEENETEYRSDKHKKIIELNRIVDVTVFQSKFVFDNVYHHIKPAKWCIIHNGSDPNIFSP